VTTLATATLQRLDRVGKPAKNKPAKVEPKGPPLSVQFNPTSLRISRSNNVDRGGVTTKTQKVQNPSSEAAKLTFDLEFDTAEQATPDGRPVDVRSWTALVRQFVEPPKDRAGKPPPAVQFTWGTLIFNGIVDQITEELDYFHADGTPLHAKVNVSISEQNFDYEAQEGPAKRDDRSATAPGETPTGTAPGSKGTSEPNQVVDAQDGESAQQLLSRLGLDPAGWRGAMDGLDSPLALTAGAGITLGGEVRAGVGLGVSAQFTADATTTDVADLARTLGLPSVGEGAPSGSSSAASGPSADGFAVSAAGGVQAAARLVDATRIADAAGAARAAFETPAVRASAPTTDLATDTVADTRALTYAAGVPLQRRANAATLTTAAAEGGRSLAARARPDEVPVASPSTPPWEGLPEDASSGRADAAQRRRDAGVSTLRWRPGGGCR
jgi:hypothetical protein